MACSCSTSNVLLTNQSLLKSPSPRSKRRTLAFASIRASTESMSSAVEKLGIKIERNPPESKLAELGVRKWPKRWNRSFSVQQQVIVELGVRALEGFSLKLSSREMLVRKKGWNHLALRSV